MDRYAANALRTLGIVLTSILLITASGVLLLASLCFGLVAIGTHESQSWNVAVVALLAAVVLIIIGAGVIAKLSRGMVRHSPPPPFPSTPSIAAPPAPDAAPDAPSFSLGPTHFSPASQAAIKNLVLAICALIVLDLLSAFVPALSPNSFRYPGLAVFPYALIYRLLAVAPYAVLAFSLRRSPGPRTFAYALAVPAIPAAWGVLSLPLLLIGAQRMPGSTLLSAPLLLLPLLMDIVILYFAWIAITRTGIHPPPKRLIIASAVLLVYRMACTGLAVFLFQMMRIAHG